MKKNRSVIDLPQCISEWGWKFHHAGMPVQEAKEGEEYFPNLKFYASGYRTNPFGIECMRFEEGCLLPEIIQRLPHLAFVVEGTLEEALKVQDFNVIIEPTPPSQNGLRVAAIEYEGFPIELMEFI